MHIEVRRSLAMRRDNPHHMATADELKGPEQAERNVEPLEDQWEAENAGYHPEGDKLKVGEEFRRGKQELPNSRTSGQNIDRLRLRSQVFQPPPEIPASELGPDQRQLG